MSEELKKEFECSYCSGTGKVFYEARVVAGREVDAYEEKCSICNGLGIIIKEDE